MAPPPRCHRQAGAVATLCRVLAAAPAEPALAEPGVKALQEISELPELQDAAMEAGWLLLDWMDFREIIGNYRLLH